MGRRNSFISRAVLLLALLIAGGCASIPEQDHSSQGGGVETDPWESMNRRIFAFNHQVDSWILKPVAQTYQAITPAPVETGINNFFSNLAEVTNVANNVLQWKWRKAGNDSGRFLLNSTIGIGGIFDVAKHAGLRRGEREDFGQTLSYWGVPAGPYVVLPFLGPSTVTDAVAFPVDWYSDPTTYAPQQREMLVLKGVEIIARRANLLEAEKLMSGDRYVFMREAYLQRREYLVQDGEVKDDFGGDFDDFDDFDDF